VFSIYFLNVCLSFFVGQAQGLFGFIRKLLNPSGKSCGCPIEDTCNNNCVSRFGAARGQCAGFGGFTCECLIQGVWQSKANRCG